MGFVACGEVVVMPMRCPGEVKRGEVAVARRGDRMVLEVAAVLGSRR